MECISTGSNIVVTLPDRFTFREVKEFLSIVHEHMEKNIHAVTIDFAATTFIESAGIGALASLARDVKAHKGSLVLRNLSEDIQELFCDTGLDAVFSIESSAGVTPAETDIFDTSVDVKLDIREEARGAVLILHLNGLMNHPVGSKFFKQKFLLALEKYHKILLDMEDLTFFDSISVSVLLNMYKLLKETGGSIRVCGPNFLVSDLFTTLNVDKVIPFFATADEALAEWD